MFEVACNPETPGSKPPHEPRTNLDIICCKRLHDIVDQLVVAALYFHNKVN